jgi:hypothetical protein
MALESNQVARPVSRSRWILLGAVVALTCPACASKEKVAAGPAGGMAPPPMTAAYDPSRQVAGSSMANPWGTPAPGMPGDGSSFTR